MIFKPKDISDGTMSVPMEYQGIKGRWLSNELFNSQEKCIKQLEKKLDIAKDTLSIAKRYFDEEASELDITGDIAKDINDALKQIEEIK